MSLCTCAAQSALDWPPSSPSDAGLHSPCLTGGVREACMVAGQGVRHRPGDHPPLPDSGRHLLLSVNVQRDEHEGRPPACVDHQKSSKVLICTPCLLCLHLRLFTLRMWSCSKIWLHHTHQTLIFAAQIPCVHHCMHQGLLAWSMLCTAGKVMLEAS